MHVPFRLLAGAAILAVPCAAVAQTAIPYTVPKLASKGAASSAITGPGKVTVQVFVKKDGSSNVIKVISSTNPGDNAAALEIAKTSKFKPATRNFVPVDAYYDFALVLGGTEAPGASPLDNALAQIHEGNYAQAKTTLQPVLAAHPADPHANLLLGVADYYSSDFGGASDAFDKSGAIADEYKILAIQSYAKNASAQLDAKDYADAVTSAGKALALDPNNLQSYYVRGIAYANQKNDAAAIADLQKAYTIAGNAKADDKTLGTIAFNLAIAQLDAGQIDDASATYKLVARYDNAQVPELDHTVLAAINNSAVGLANNGKYLDAVTQLESGAATYPSVAAPLLSQAAHVMAIEKTPDWMKVKAEAEKALALDPTDGRADFYAGYAAAELNDPKAALNYMQKAKSSPTYGTDSALAKQVDDALKTLNASAKG